MGSGNSMFSAKGNSRTATFLQEAGIPISTQSGSVSIAIASIANLQSATTGTFLAQQGSAAQLAEASNTPTNPVSRDFIQRVPDRGKCDDHLVMLGRRFSKAIRTGSRPKIEQRVTASVSKRANVAELRNTELTIESSQGRLGELPRPSADTTSSPTAGHSAAAEPQSVKVQPRPLLEGIQAFTRKVKADSELADLSRFGISRASTISNPSTASFRVQSSTRNQNRDGYASSDSSTSFSSLPDVSSEPIQRRHTLMPVRKPLFLDTVSSEASDRAIAEKLQLEEYSSRTMTQDNNPFRRLSVGPQNRCKNRPSQQNDVFRKDWDTSTPDLLRDEILARRLYEQEKALSQSQSQKGKQREESDHALALQMHLELIDEGLEIVMRECIVCGDGAPAADLPALMNCSHEPRTCPDCYGGWIASQLEEKGWRRIGCPESGCGQILEHGDVQRYSSAEVFQRFDALSAREALSEDTNFRWCKGTSCESGQIHLGGTDDPIFTCNACGHQVCIVHEGTWHQGETCEEYDYRSSGKQARDQAAQEEASRAAVEKLTKKCPGKGCSYNIEKNDGCDHMTCLKCRYQFCWVCLAGYNAIRLTGNKAHKKGCTHYA